MTLVTGGGDSYGCDQLAFGYQLDSSSNVQLATKPTGCACWGAFGNTITPGAGPHTLQLHLEDTGGYDGSSCDFVYYSNGDHACARPTGTGSWDVTFLDSFICDPTFGPGPRCPSDGNFENNLRVSLSIS